MGQWIERVYAEHRQGLFSLALTIVHAREDAEDSVHEAFVRLCRQPTDRLDDPTAYVYAAVRNAALDRVRSGKAKLRAVSSLFRSMETPAGDPMTTLLDRERDRQVQAAVEALPAEKRELVVMKLYGQLTFAQIAAVLEEPLSTVATRYQRALDELRAQLEVKTP